MVHNWQNEETSAVHISHNLILEAKNDLSNRSQEIPYSDDASDFEKLCMEISNEETWCNAATDGTKKEAVLNVISTHAVEVDESDTVVFMGASDQNFENFY